MKRILLLLVCAAAFLAAQDYVVTREVALTATAEAVTIQAPATMTPGTVTFAGVGLNDMTATGAYDGTASATYCVKIAAEGTPDTFSWGTNVGCNDGATAVLMTGAAQALNHGVTVTFKATTGHTLAESWSFPVLAPLRAVHPVGARVQCSVECNLTLERDGTAATTTAATPVALLPQAPAAVTKAFVASNVGAGSVVGRYTITAGDWERIDLTRFRLFGLGTAKNLTLRFASMTGTVKVIILFTEER